MNAAGLDTDRLARQLAALQQQVAGLQAGSEMRPAGDLLAQALSNLQVTVEELRVAEEELRQQADELAAANDLIEAERRRYQHLFEAAPDGYLVTTADGRILEANAAAGRLLNRPPKRLRGKPLPLYVAREQVQHFRQQLLQAASSDFALDWDTRLENGIAGPRTVVCRVAPVRRPDTGELHELRWFLLDITERQRIEAEAEAARVRLAEVSARMEAVREEERGRIAQAVHDEIGAALTAIKIEVSHLRHGLEKLGEGRAGGSALLAHSDDAVRLIDETVQTVRRISLELRPAILDEFGLVAALDWQLTEFEKRTQVKCAFNVKPGRNQVPPPVATAVFRVLQEILTNVARHAGATRVNVSLHEDQGNLKLIVRDNGRGITAEEAEGGTSLGLLGMHERVRPYGGLVEISGRPDAGTRVRVTIPLEAPPPS